MNSTPAKKKLGNSKGRKSRLNRLACGDSEMKDLFRTYQGHKQLKAIAVADHIGGREVDHDAEFCGWVADEQSLPDEREVQQYDAAMFAVLPDQSAEKITIRLSKGQQLSRSEMLTICRVLKPTGVIDFVKGKR